MRSVSEVEAGRPAPEQVRDLVATLEMVDRVVTELEEARAEIARLTAELTAERQQRQELQEWKTDAERNLEAKSLQVEWLEAEASTLRQHFGPDAPPRRRHWWELRHGAEEEQAPPQAPSSAPMPPEVVADAVTPEPEPPESD